MIRRMKIEDLDKVMEIEHELFPEPWKREDYEDQFSPDKADLCYLYVAEENDGIVGVSGFWQIFERAEIITIGVTSDYQGKGLGKALLEEMISAAIKNESEIMLLEVRVSNTKAIKLYESHGFETLRVRKDYYSDNHEDAYEMCKVLGGLNA